MNATALVARLPRRPWRYPGWLALAGIALVSLFVATPLTREANQWFEDSLVRLQPRAPHPDIVIVAIDDKSLAALGRWPWPRSRHAELINRLSAGGARVIGLDLMLVDPGDPEQDRALARAMAASQRVVLPMIMQTVDGVATPTAPLPILERETLALGHVHLPLDTDSLVRQVYLREGTAHEHWEHFAQVIYRQVVRAPNAIDNDARWPTQPDIDAWQRHDPIGIAYAGPAGHFPRISYIDVLEGHVAPEQLRDKLVLIGVTAAGMGDQFATPLSRHQSLMPGVEVHANVLDSLLQGRALSAAQPSLIWLLNLLPVGLMVLAIASRPIGPAGSLLLALALATASALGAGFLQREANLLVSPMAGILTLFLIGLLHWWRQWNRNTGYVTAELQRFRGGAAPAATRPSLAALLGDPLRQRIRSLGEMVQELREVHRFVRDSLDALPDATLVCDAQGRILLANAVAARYAPNPDPLPPTTEGDDRRTRPSDGLRGQHVRQILQILHFSEGHAEDVVRELMRQPPRVISVPATNSQNRNYLVKCVPAQSAGDRRAHWVVSIVDVSDIMEVQRQRDQAIGFMSHDIRAPQSAILSLLELRRKRPEMLSAEQFEDRVERHARRALSLADGFIQLARAQSRDYHLQTMDLVDLVREATDDHWEIAQKHGIGLTFSDGPALAMAQVDRELLTRAIGNLLGNATKFSPPQSRVSVAIRAEHGHWVVSVSDEGPGIAPETQADLFKPFFRDPSVHRVDGAGLGLPFVHAVMQGLGGQVVVHSQLGVGSRFELWVPASGLSS